MHNTMLIPLDGSKRAEAILRHVEELAQRFDARVVFLQVIEPIGLVVGADGAYLTLRQKELERRTKEAQSYLTALQSKFREKGIKAQTRVAHGSIWMRS